MDPRLAYARELDERDSRLAARIERVLALGRRADHLRSRAEALEAQLALLPELRAQLAAASAEAERSLSRARAAHAEAARAQPASGDATERLQLRVVQAVTEERAAEERQARLAGRLAALEQDETRLREEADALRLELAELADALEREPRTASPRAPAGEELAAVAAWAARAHAAVLVARAGLEVERERIVREANELASSVLGEALQATSAASVRGRLERTLA